MSLVVKTEYDLYAIPVNEMVKHVASFKESEIDEASDAFSALTEDKAMRAVFLDCKRTLSNRTQSISCIKKWRKRAHKTQGQVG